MRVIGSAVLAVAIGVLLTNSLPAGELNGSSLPSGWTFVGGAWQVKSLTEPGLNQSAVAAVTSTQHVAFPGICKTQDGALLITYREGLTHASADPSDGRIMLVRSTDGGTTWSQPVVAYDDPTIDDRNPAISCMSDGTIALIWDKYSFTADQHQYAWMQTSKDGGLNWSAAARVSNTQNVHTRSPVLDLGDGTWLIPYSESDNTSMTASFVNIYNPQTKTRQEIAVTPRGQRNVADEISVTRAADQSLVALIRSNDDTQLFQIKSTDNGRTWSTPQMNGIPSIYTPADIITLQNGWLAASFSFRERSNERLVVSRDNGATWDVENSVDVYDMRGGDRSYPASVQLDAQTIGTVLYETSDAPYGGNIWFARTDISSLSAPKRNALYQGDTNSQPAFALWPSAKVGENAEFSYRFTGNLGDTANIVGLLMHFDDSNNYTAFEFRMGASWDWGFDPQAVQLVRCKNGVLSSSVAQGTVGDWFNDGNIHRIAAQKSGNRWVFSIDGIDQFSAALGVGAAPCGIFVQGAAVAFYDCTAVPEPSGILLLMSAAVSLLAYVWRKKEIVVATGQNNAGVSV